MSWGQFPQIERLTTVKVSFLARDRERTGHALKLNLAVEVEFKKAPFDSKIFNLTKEKN